VRFFLAVRV